MENIKSNTKFQNFGGGKCKISKCCLLPSTLEAHFGCLLMRRFSTQNTCVNSFRTSLEKYLRTSQEYRIMLLLRNDRVPLNGEFAQFALSSGVI